jgi:RNA polymerase sigma factor (sigma-70 family)
MPCMKARYGVASYFDWDWGIKAGPNRSPQRERAVAIRDKRSSGDLERQQLFEQAVLPHLDAAYNLARWLTQDSHDAEDVVQEAYLRAFKFFGGFHGLDVRPWLLKIVRNTCYTWLQQHRGLKPAMVFDETRHSALTDAVDPEALLQKSEDRELLRRAVESLPLEFREVVILRDLEELSYKEIAELAGIPMGTVMSRLARGRERLQQSLAGHMNEEP